MQILIFPNTNTNSSLERETVGPLLETLTGNCRFKSSIRVVSSQEGLLPELG